MIKQPPKRRLTVLLVAYKCKMFATLSMYDKAMTMVKFRIRNPDDDNFSNNPCKVADDDDDDELFSRVSRSPNGSATTCASNSS